MSFDDNQIHSIAIRWTIDYWRCNARYSATYAPLPWFTGVVRDNPVEHAEADREFWNGRVHALELVLDELEQSHGVDASRVRRFAEVQEIPLELKSMISFEGLTSNAKSFYNEWMCNIGVAMEGRELLN